ENLLPAAAHPADDVLSRLDAFNETFIARFGSDPNDVARDDNVPQLGAQVFEQSANCAAKLPPVVRLHDARQAVNTESSPAKSRFCHVAKHAEARRSRIGLLANDRSLSRQLAFAADAL